MNKRCGVEFLIEIPGKQMDVNVQLSVTTPLIKCLERFSISTILPFLLRYNLAKITYIPYLLSNNINTELVLERPEWEHMFSDENSR